MQNILLMLLLVVCGTLVSPASAQINTLAQGKSAVTINVGELPMELFCYKPASYSGERLIVVMHGVNRNADEYRDNAMGMADRLRALIIAPKFDKDRFPSIKYNRGGILTEDKKPVPPSEWTYQLIPKIVQQVRQQEARPDLPFWIIGHSAGGQFIARMSAFVAIGAERMVAANPGSQLFPTRLLPFGYGFGDLPEELSSDQQIRNYLAAPLTIYLGTADDRPDEYFDDSPEAMEQGPSRYQRGLACFEKAKKVAEENGWDFGWQIVQAEGVGHDHKAMFDHPQCETALFGPE